MARSSKRTSPAIRAVPDPKKRLSDGVLVDACIRARLLGIPLLKIEASIVLAPAGLTGPPPAGSSRPVRAASPPSRLRESRERLSEAVRTINQGAEILADARSNGSSRPDPRNRA
jgi:hypothetical protein